MTYQIYYTNFGYGSMNVFTSVEEAVAFGKNRGFEFTVSPADDRADILYSWSPIFGARILQAA